MRAPRSLIILLVAVLFAFASPGSASASAPDPPALEVRSTQASGTTFAWAELGEGPTLLLLNGTASPMNEWDPLLLTELARERRVIVLDYPGLGLSGPAPGPWRFPAAADWIAGFLADVVGDAPVDVLGWSMGGFIAQQLAIRHPERVGSLILASTNPGGDAAVLGPRWVQEADGTGGARAYLLTNYPRGERNAGRAFLSRLDEAISSGAYPRETVPDRTARAMVLAEDPWLRSNANLRSLRSITHPTLVMTGAEDVITPAINSRRIADRIPGSHLVLMPESGHSFLFQRPRATARLVLEFLDAETDARAKDLQSRRPLLAGSTD